MSHRSRLRSIWNRVDSGELHQAPRKWQSWLSDTGSLTQKIERAIGHKLEVLVCLNQVPLVMAHSIIPTTSSCGSNHPILRLGKRPLGAVLFAKTHQHSKQKARREIAHLDQHNVLWKKSAKRYPDLPSPVWGRRTLYSLKGRPLLVTEIFLPSLLSYQAKS